MGSAVEVAQAHRIMVQRERDAVDAVDCATARAHYLRGAYEAAVSIEGTLRERAAADAERAPAVELARFPIVGDAAVVAVVVREATGDLDGGFIVAQVDAGGREVLPLGPWYRDATPAVVYAAQLAGWPVKRTEWAEVGHADYWPVRVAGGREQVTR